MIDYVLRPAGSRRERGRDHRDPIAGLRCAGHDRRSGPRGAQKEKKRRDENEDEGKKGLYKQGGERKLLHGRAQATRRVQSQAPRRWNRGRTACLASATHP
ncbi:unnamed protein product, partial [Prorocentrum cordatum]